MSDDVERAEAAWQAYRDEYLRVNGSPRRSRRQMRKREFIAGFLFGVAEGRAEVASALNEAAREVDEAASIPITARAAVSAVLRGRARRATLAGTSPQERQADGSRA